MRSAVLDMRRLRPTALGSRRDRARGARGFTLIEVLLAIGILAVGASTVLFLFTMGARSHRRARDRTRAALLADAVVNQVKADLAGGDPPARYNLQSDDTTRLENRRSADFPGFVYDLTLEPLYQGDLYPDYYVVRVRVWWGEWFSTADNPNRDPSGDSTVFEVLIRRKNF